MVAIIGHRRPTTLAAAASSKLFLLNLYLEVLQPQLLGTYTIEITLDEQPVSTVTVPSVCPFAREAAGEVCGCTKGYEWDSAISDCVGCTTGYFKSETGDE